MGPPKKRPPKPNFADIRRKWNIFEYRWSDETDSYYMFNPWTGETIFDTNLELLDRTKSMWAPPEKYPSENAVTVSIYPEFYASRRWGRRRFTGWESEYAAATMIAALVRGYLARLLLRRIFKERFILEFDANSGYYYFIDTENRHLDTSWYKPLLAFPNDIELIPVEDPEDYMRGNKFSKQDTTVGPFLKIAGPNKHMTTRAEQSAFLVRNEWRDTALSSYEEIDVDKVPIGSVIPWMLGMKCGSLLVTEFHAVRAAITNGNWSRTLQFMKSNSDNILIQIYGFHSFSKTEVPLDDSGLLNFTAGEVMQLCMDIVIDKERKYPTTLKIYAFEAFNNIISLRVARMEFIDTNRVPEQGELRDAAVEAYLNQRLSIFNKYLKNIPYENYNVFEKNKKEPIVMQRPLPQSIAMVDVVLRILGEIAHEIETKAHLAFLVIHPLLFALDICKEEASVVMAGLKLMYNLCYRCEAGQEAILSCIRPTEFFAVIFKYHSGDPGVQRQMRRVELSLKKDGWTGNVENLIELEMYGYEIDAEYLQPSPFERK